jgi:hypothetical protein
VYKRQRGLGDVYKRQAFQLLKRQESTIFLSTYP